MEIILEPIGIVHSERTQPTDDHWNDVTSFIELYDKFPIECLDGLETFSHVEIVFYFNRVIPSSITYGSEHPRENKNWPKVGIFAQRKKSRPNLIGTTISKIERIQGRRIYVSCFDAIDETPIIDIKPVYNEFIPKDIHEPQWVSELMKDYW